MGICPDLADYLKIDGSRAMTGDLDLASNRLLFNDVLIKQNNPFSISIRNRADTLFRGLAVDNFTANYGKPTSSIYRLETWNNVNHEIQIKSYDGAALQTTSYSKGGEQVIPRAGDITMLSGKTLNAFNAELRVPRSTPPTWLGCAMYYNRTTKRLYIYNDTISDWDFAQFG